MKEVIYYLINLFQTNLFFCLSVLIGSLIFWFVLLYNGFKKNKNENAFTDAFFLSVLFWILSGFIVALIFAILKCI